MSLHTVKSKSSMEKINANGSPSTTSSATMPTNLTYTRHSARRAAGSPIPPSQQPGEHLPTDSKYAIKSTASIKRQSSGHFVSGSAGKKRFRPTWTSIVTVLAAFAFGVYITGVVYVALDIAPSVWTGKKGGDRVETVVANGTGSSGKVELKKGAGETLQAATESKKAAYKETVDKSIQDANSRWEARYNSLLAEVEALRKSKGLDPQGAPLPGSSSTSQSDKNVKIKDSTPLTAEHHPVFGPDASQQQAAAPMGAPDTQEAVNSGSKSSESSTEGSKDTGKKGTRSSLKVSYTDKIPEENDEYDQIFYKPFLPTSSVWCRGNSLFNRACRFQNLCYYPPNQKWFIVKTTSSILEGLPDDHRTKGLVEPSAVHDHNAFRFYIDEISPTNPMFYNKPVRHIKTLHFLHQRFQPANIMHVFHDDAFGLYHLINEHLGPQSLTPLSKTFATSTNKSHPSQTHSSSTTIPPYRIFMIDEHLRWDPASRPLDYLSPLPFKMRVQIDADPNVVTCFENAVMGTPKHAMFYQYGLYEPQSPFLMHAPKGVNLRKVVGYYVQQLGLSLTLDEMEDFGAEVGVKGEGGQYKAEEYERVLEGRRFGNPLPPSRLMAIQSGDEEAPNMDEGVLNAIKAEEQLEKNGGLQLPDPRFDVPPETDLIIIMSRRKNRLILNEKEIAEHLTKKYKLQTLFLRMEDHTFEEQVRYLRRARVVVGMHGSMLVMAAFCKRGTVVVELFPYGVRSGDFAPYKTMAELPGMGLVYRAWENHHPNASIAHEDWDEDLGGISHFPAAQQAEIRSTRWVPRHVCCYNPHWLYRIYQDTSVDIPELTLLLDSAFTESQKLLRDIRLRRTSFSETNTIKSPIVKNEHYHCHSGPQKKPGDLWLSWDPLWTGPKPDMWIVKILREDSEQGDHYSTPVNEVAIPGFKEGERVFFMVKPLFEGGEDFQEYGQIGNCDV
ncbi:Protein O-linked-mannose beta-1,4-N-acetylglucosaminyltransferase 2 [Chytridiales sp. JEL 0842]|nr:Protein O-linked-mannose beta-1,4-N-acetylglucosaminyltransferase 2 [Chytridiales sp. JEL 0842]